MEDGDDAQAGGDFWYLILMEVNCNFSNVGVISEMFDGISDIDVCVSLLNQATWMALFFI